MATNVKGSAIENATSYKLYKKDGTNYIELATQNESGEINFSLDDLSLANGTYILVVKAFDSTGAYSESAYSNELTYTVGEVYDYIDFTSNIDFNPDVIISGIDGSAALNQDGWKHGKYIDISAYAGGKMRITLPTLPTIPSNLGIAFYTGSKSSDAVFISGKIASQSSSYGYETVELDIPDNAGCFRTTWYEDTNPNYNSSWVFKCEVAHVAAEV